MRTVTQAVIGAALVMVSLASLALPTIERWETAQGTPVYYVYAPELPLLDVRVVFAAGSARDGERPGLASLTNALLGEGTERLDVEEFHAALEATGAQLSNEVQRDMAWLSLRTLSDPARMKPAIALFEEALARPRFAPEDFARERAQALVRLEREQESPDALADRAFFRAIYGTHPYASPVDGTPESVKALAVEDLGEFYRRHYVQRNATVAIVGAIARADAEALAERLVAGLPQGEPAPPLPPVEPLARGEALHIEFPSIQSHVMLGQPGLTRDDTDYFPLVVGNHVLGGNAMVSLLFDAVRERRGLSYSVTSHFEPMAQMGPFIASLQTDGAQQAEAIEVMRETIAQFVREGPTEEALAAAKQNIIGGFPLRIDNNAKLMEYLTVIGFYDLPLDWLETYPKRVAAVTREDVKEAFARRIALDRMAEVTVGRADAAQAAANAPQRPPG